jgi:hypothetical protein
MNAGRLKAAAAVLFFIAIISIAIPVPALADGGPVVRADLWPYLTEGNQVAVITLLSEEKAKIDLFISILDSTTESHEVVFFVPVGVQTTDFTAVEKTISRFNSQMTQGLDSILRQAADDKRRALQTLFGGALLTNGALLTPLWAPVLLTGCAATQQKAELTLTTESSQISVYGIDEDTDIDDLIETTGLPGSVRDTLARMRGQQIAVVSLQTQPQSQNGEGNIGPHGEITEPGLHLSWKTSFINMGSRPTYAYPLGTGASWSKPIELTRVYVVAPWGLDFDVEYPAIGSRESGYDYIHGARISDYFDIPAYAVDEARGDFGRIWRATYTLSNAAEDITITAKKLSAFGKFVARAQDSAGTSSFIFALVVGLAVWITGWILLMPRFLGQKTGQEPKLRWYFSLVYPLLNILIMVFPCGILFIMFNFGLRIPALLGVFVIMGGASLGFFMHFHGRLPGVSEGRAIRAFIFTSLISSTAYLVLAVVFALIIHVL